ncbi:MAG TPA: MarC family protein [Methylophilaceae bacterium]|jgi:multiple antibiotic resistance protein
MFEWSYLIKTGIALFAIVNPIGTVPVFIAATEGWSEDGRKRVANTVGLTVFLVLASSAIFGDKILAFFSISIPSFEVGGGILLMLIAISMMYGKLSEARQTREEAEAVMDREAIAIVPLSIPLLAGPGAISSMIIASQQHPGLVSQTALALPIGIVCLIIWLTLRLSSRIAAHMGTIGINVVTRLMGLILAAMAVEFIAHGLQGLFPRLA